MVERQSGVKSYVRIAKSSMEQVGYERHRTRPVPVSRPGPSGARTTSRVAAKNKKTAFWFQGGPQKFLQPALEAPLCVSRAAASLRSIRMKQLIGRFESKA